MTDIINWAKATLAFGSVAFMVAVLLVGALLLMLRPRWGKRWVVAVAAIYWFVSTPLGSTALVTPLVRGFSSIESQADAGPVGAIVVLGGGIRDMKVRSEQLAYPYESTTLRVLEGARLFRLLGSSLFVVASGGFTSSGRRTSEGEVMAEALAKLGVPSDRILLEEESFTTHDQAIQVTRLLRSRGIVRFVLVTAPTHMSRSIAVFRAQGAEVVPSVAAFVPDDRPERRFFAPNEDSLQLSDNAVYAYAGLVYYWARGWLRPAPAETAR